MSNEERPEDKIVRLMREAAPKPSEARTKRGEKPSLAGNQVSAVGDGNIIAGGDIHYNAGPAQRPKVTVKTGDGVIDARQKAEIMARVKQWNAAHNVIRRNKMTMAAAWSAFNAAMKVNSYAELRPEQLPAALGWLGRQRAILNSMKSAPTRVPGFRGEMIKAIKARSRQLGDDGYYRPYITTTYGLSSLTGLSDRQLQEVRAWIMRQKRG